MTRVFLDSNVLLSSLIGAAHSAPTVLIDWLAGRQDMALVTGRCCIQEIQRNIAKKLPQAQPIWEKFLVAVNLQVEPCPRTPVPGINAKDTPVVAAAIAMQADFFVAGDKKLIAEMQAAHLNPPRALTPREMLETLVTTP